MACRSLWHVESSSPTRDQTLTPCMRECRVKAIVPPGKSLATDSDSRIWIWCKILQVILIVSAYFLRTRENLILVLSHPFFFKKKINLFACARYCGTDVVAHGIFNLCCCIWDLVPWPGIERKVLATWPPGKSPRPLLNWVIFDTEHHVSWRCTMYWSDTFILQCDWHSSVS